MKSTEVWAFVGGVLVAMIIGMVADALTAPHGSSRQADTVTEWRTRYVPQPAETIHVAEPARVDTHHVVREYFTKKVYRDTIVENDTVQLVVRDTVYENALGEREVSLKVNTELFRKHHAIGLMGAMGRHQADLMGTYRRDRWTVAAGWDFEASGPVIGLGYTIKEW
ncbi:MAG: hypothetical protein J5953_13705 [Prevotella sp.]|nr:hypothetical protein [Prevotella sp.]